MSDQRPPSGLKASGKRLWLSVADRYVLTAAEVEMLGQACRTADELDRLEKAVRELTELTTTGSTGQLKPHPLLAEVRADRTLLERLTTALCLPNEDQETGRSPGQKHGQRAIRARWKEANRVSTDSKLAELKAFAKGLDGGYAS